MVDVLSVYFANLYPSNHCAGDSDIQTLALPFLQSKGATNECEPNFHHFNISDLLSSAETLFPEDETNWNCFNAKPDKPQEL